MKYNKGDKVRYIYNDEEGEGYINTIDNKIETAIIVDYDSGKVVYIFLHNILKKL